MPWKLGVRRSVVVVLLGVVLLGVFTELFARFYLGLGTPPLFMAHPSIEYMFKPDQDVVRFGNHFFVNAYGMRSENFPKHKRSPDEFRVMVVGDSVVNGGNLTDHARLATTVLQKQLSQRLGVPVVVGNISAGSWGPENYLRYAQEYGFFDADMVVLVISSHDAADNPAFGPLNPNTHPTRSPLFAVGEGLTRYLPKYLNRLGRASGSGGGTAEEPAALDAGEVERGLDGLRGFIALAAASGARVCVMQHWERGEVEGGGAYPGHDTIREACGRVGVPVIQLDGYFRRALGEGHNPYRDSIHPNDTGQAVLAQALLDTVLGVPGDAAGGATAGR